MSAPGRPERDAAGSACRNAAAAIDEWYARVRRAVARLPKDDWPCALCALHYMDKAIKELDKAADKYYKDKDEEEKQ